MNDLERRFLHHSPASPAVAHSHNLVRRSSLALAKILEQLPESRERSVALTKIEEASFWAHAAIARGQVAFPAVVKALEERQIPPEPVAAIAAVAPEGAPQGEATQEPADEAVSPTVG